MSSSPFGRREPARAGAPGLPDEPERRIPEHRFGRLGTLLEIADAQDRGDWPLAAYLQARERGGG